MKSVKPRLKGFIIDTFTVLIILDMKQNDIDLADKIYTKLNPDYNKRDVGLPDGWSLNEYDTCHLNFEFEISHLPTQDEIDETKNRLSAIIDEIRKETK